MGKELLVVLGVCLISGCAIRDNLQTPFNNPTNTPILHDGSGDGGDPANGQVRYCVPGEDGKYDGAAINVDVTLEAGDVAQAKGGGCVLRPIREVWAVLNNVDEMKFEAADRFVANRTVNPKPGLTHLYEITYYKSSGIPISIHWTLEWYHGFGGGTFEAPTSVNVNFQKTLGAGTIPVWQGGIVLTKVTDTVTSVGVLNQFRASQPEDANKQSALDGFNEMIRHMRNGPPDWSRLNTGLKENPDQPDPSPAPPTMAEDAPSTTAIAPVRDAQSSTAVK